MKFTGDYRKKFEEETTKLIEQNIYNRDVRMNAINELINRYVSETGERPASEQLDRLSDYILREELTDTRKSKSRLNEYPFLSADQFAYRNARQAPFSAASTHGSDGKDHRKPTPRKRTKFELTVIDKKAKGENRERRRKYTEAKKPSEVKTYKLIVKNIENKSENMNKITSNVP